MRGVGLHPPATALSQKRLDLTSLQTLLAEDEGWTEWLDFFLQGVRDTANQVARTAGKIEKLAQADKEKIEPFGRGSGFCPIAPQICPSQPSLLDQERCSRGKGKLSYCLLRSGPNDRSRILRESSGQRRDRLFLYERYLDLLNQDS